MNRRLDGLGVSLRYLVDVEANKLTAAQASQGEQGNGGQGSRGRSMKTLVATPE